MPSITLDLAPFGSQSQSSLPDDMTLLDALQAGLEAGRLIAMTGAEDLPWWRFDMAAPLPVARLAMTGLPVTAGAASGPLDIHAISPSGTMELIGHLGSGLRDDIATVLTFSPPVMAKALVVMRRGTGKPLGLPAIAIDGDVMAFPSLAQIAQDRWVIAMLQGMREGRFVEFGSTDGVELSNTFALESMFGWTGVCVEPNPAYFRKLTENRSAICVERAAMVGPERIVEFVAAGVLGTVTDYMASDHYDRDRAGIAAAEGVLRVKTMEPNAILALAGGGAPDFISLDVEGAELDILNSIDFSRFDATLWAIEHNYVAEKREAVRVLMAKQGYERVLAQWDDWYFSRERLARRIGSADHVNRVLQAFHDAHGYGPG